MARRADTIASLSFPLYAIRSIGNQHFLVAGGGGQAKTGVPNAFEIFELKFENGECVVEPVLKYDVGDAAPMNCAIIASGKDFTLAAGMDDSCQLFNLKYKVVTESEDKGQSEEGLRKRKGSLSKSNESRPSKISFDVEEVNGVKTDFHPSGGFQKVVRATQSGPLIATGGADGHIRIWQYPSLKKAHQIKAHSNDIDDLDINPQGTQLVSVSRDNHGYVWSMKDGTKVTGLEWPQKTGNVKYRIRNCRYATIVDQKDGSRLVTSHIPCVQSSKQPCYLTLWETKTYKAFRIVSVGQEIVSSMSINDDGTYLGIGTISGSVSVYITFSLQRLYHVREAHNIFVTGLEFTPSTPAARAVTGDSDFTLLSISADNSVKMHQIMPRVLWSPLWAVAGFIVIIYLFFWFISALSL